MAFWDSRILSSPGIKGFGVWICLSYLLSCHNLEASIQGNFSELIEPLDSKSSAVVEAQKELDLLPIPASSIKGNSIQVRSEDARYAIIGDLFKNGRIYAIVELNPTSAYDAGIAFAEIKGTHLNLLSLWKIYPNWRPKGWKKSDNDYLPITPAEYPFALKDLNGDGVPEVIFCGEIWRYWQEFYVLKYEIETNQLKLLVEAMGEPELVNGYLRLYFNSGHRAIYEAWELYSWKEGKLIKETSWHDESPYNNIDPAFTDIEALGKNGKLETFRVIQSEENTLPGEVIYTVTKNGDFYATIHFLLDKSKGKGQTQIRSGMEAAWIFNYLTGLPSDLIPSLCDGGKLCPPFQEYGKVTLKGTRDSVERLGLRKEQQESKPIVSSKGH